LLHFQKGMHFLKNRACLSHFRFKNYTSISFSLNYGNKCDNFLPNNTTTNKKLIENLRGYSPPKLNERTEKMLIGLRNGDRRALAKAITLVESELDCDIQQADALIETITKEKVEYETQNKIQTFRIGFSGSPGVGKSTLIDTLGVHILRHTQHKIAVLTVDPTSSRSGGSILGDKTRMTNLAKHEDRTFIRPSPSSGHLGGLTRSTYESILLCEEAGYNIILIETVGVGQSEIEVNEVVDFFSLLVAPAAGDELQGIKKGIIEMADQILVTKYDGDLVQAARNTQYEYTTALRLLQPKSTLWTPKVILCSALSGEGIQTAWENIQAFWTLMQANGELSKARAIQREKWMWRLFHESVMRRLASQLSLTEDIQGLEALVRVGAITPRHAVKVLTRLLFHDDTEKTIK
jgi:LAO/AO transport system kinase